VEVSYLNTDARPAFVFDDVKNVDMHNVKGQVEKGVEQFMYINSKR
ncbi:MAG: hypothetical protein JST32_03735, partial [Bacteroidetes bacterium]|nr:hypothetical protein [Bacteroidota bacterium]